MFLANFGHRLFAYLSPSDNEGGKLNLQILVVLIGGNDQPSPCFVAFSQQLPWKLFHPFEVGHTGTTSTHDIAIHAYIVRVILTAKSICAARTGKKPVEDVAPAK